MKKLIGLLVMLTATTIALGQGSASNAPLRVSELDGSPSRAGVTWLKVPNGSLAISGATATLTFASGGAQLNVAQTWTAAQSFTANMLLASGSLLKWNNDILIYRVNANSLGIGNVDASELRDLYARNGTFLGALSQTDSGSNDDIRGTISNNASGTNLFGGNISAAGNLISTTAGKGLQLQSGTGQRAGNATLVGGTVTVSNTTVTANTVVLLTRKTSGGTVGRTITYTVSAGTSFTIQSDDVLDTSTFSYLLLQVN